MLGRIARVGCLVALTFVGAGVASAAPPSGYRCGKGGKPSPAAEACACPKSKRAARGDDDVAVCVAKSKPTKGKPAKPAGLARADEDAAAQARAAWIAAGSIKGGPEAERAARLALAVAEQQFSTVLQPYQLTESAPTLARSKAMMAALQQVIIETQDQYMVLEQYGVTEYTMAAMVRYGDCLDLFADKMAAAPVPTYILDVDRHNPDAGATKTFNDAMARQLAKYVAEATKLWIQVVDWAQRDRVSNRWSQRARANLHRVRPDEFPAPSP